MSKTSTNPERSLSGVQKRHLRGLAHSLKPVIHIGKQGLTESLCHQVGQLLFQHELIKVKVLDACPLDRKTCAQSLAEQTQADVVQMIGKLLVLYRPHPEEPIIQLP